MSAADELQGDLALSDARFTRYEDAHAENVHQNAVHNLGGSQKLALINGYVVNKHRGYFCGAEKRTIIFLCDVNRFRRKFESARDNKTRNIHLEQRVYHCGAFVFLHLAHIFILGVT